MNLSEIFIRRPVMTTLVMLGILLFVAAMIGLTRESHFRTPPPRTRPTGPHTPG